MVVKTQAHLASLDILDFDVIYGMDKLYPYHEILDCYDNIVTFTYPRLTSISVKKFFELIS